MHDSVNDSRDTQELLERVRAGDRTALDRLMMQYRPFISRFVELRLDARLRARVDASDVVQETQFEAARRIDDYLKRRPMPFRLWLRATAAKRLGALWRQHVAASRRTVGREMALPEQSSIQLAQRLMSAAPTPSEMVRGQETTRLVRQAVARLNEADREIIVMRNLEELSNEEVACVLELDPGTASKRYGRALIRLHKILVDMGVRGSQP